MCPGAGAANVADVVNPNDEEPIPKKANVELNPLNTAEACQKKVDGFYRKLQVQTLFIVQKS